MKTSATAQAPPPPLHLLMLMCAVITTPCMQVYGDAGAVLAALADKLRASPGRFLFGAKPSSLDALLFGHLSFYRTSPVAAPALQEKVATQPVLCAYIDNIFQTAFAEPMPHAAGPSSSRGGDGAESSQWSEAARGQSSKPARHEPTQTELDMRRKGRYWLGAASSAIAAYVLLSGRYVQVEQLRDVLQSGVSFIEVDEDEDLDEAGEQDDDVGAEDGGGDEGSGQQ